ncbi:MAG: hypothetical protein KF802_15025 [Bdellovibrionaceae bacterium]|nr:hypothetical protein [Pseudobdellovibrionaceae bacterium]MBX3035080.1 hypothetical protein [Pseudobdellovibrionaceae bacterium]
MKALKILSLGADPLLKEAGAHFREFYGPRGVDIQWDTREVADAAAFSALMAGNPEVDAVRLVPDLCEEYLAKCPVQPLPVSRYRTADAFYRRQGVWEPELLAEESVRRVIMRQAHHLDLRESAYVAGSGVFLRVVGGVALGLGFRRVYLVGENEADLNEQARSLMKLYVGSEVQALPAHQLTVQTVGGSLLVNTLNLASRPELAADLAYFNFMRRGGLVMDLHGGPSEQLVLEEALRADLRIVPPHEFSGQSEYFFAERLGLGSLASERDFLNSWFEWLRRLMSAGTAKNPTSVQ